MPILRRPVKGARSSSVHMMPETDGLSKLPDQPINVQPSRSEVGKKVNTMKERNKVVSPTSNPASAPPHLQRTAHPVVGRKRSFQQGGQLSKEELDAKLKAWHNSPEWYAQASGRADITDSPVDYLMLGPTEATGKLLWKAAASTGEAIAKPALATLGALGSMGYMDLNGTESKAISDNRTKVQSIFNSVKKKTNVNNSY